MSRYILFAVLLSAHLANANNTIFNDLISCELDHGDAINCSLNSSKDYLELVPKQAWPADYSVAYSFQCNPGDSKDSPLGLSTDLSNSFAIKYNSDGTIPLSGSGGLYLVNTNPSRFHAAMFNGDCTLSLRVNFGPRSDVIAAWQTQKNTLEHNINTYRDAANAYQSLAKLLPAFELLHSVFIRLTDDLSRDVKVKDRFIELQDLLDEVVMTDVSGLSLDQKKLIFKIINHLEMLSQTDCQKESCPAFVLEKYITEEDLRMIEVPQKYWTNLIERRNS